ncbi:glycosyltransferase family 39 protein [bacterium]|jgi:4-amino-4-deoxy-L-arabinose transferase-like glycosyltransferase|nr:glycosyltransferase family 39 protein [bacterium]
MKRNHYLILAAILFGALFARIGPVNKPLLGNFSSYQTATAMMARFIANEGLPAVAQPKTNLLINGKPAIHMLYIPGAAATAGYLWKIFGFSLDFWGRFQASFFTMLSSLLIYLIVRRHSDEATGLMSCFFFNAFPLSFVYGQSFMNEALAFFLVMLSSWLLFNFKINSYKVIAAGLIVSLAFLMRIHFLCLVPALLFLIWYNAPKNKILYIALFSICIAIPVAGWYLHTYYVASVADNNITSIFAQENKHYASFPHPLFLKAVFYKDIIDKLAGVCLNPIGFTLVIAGVFLCRPEKKEYWAVILWLLGSLSVIILLPQKVYDHNFYFYPILFPASFFAALVTFKIIKLDRYIYVILFLCLFFLVSARYFINPAFKYSVELSAVPEAGYFIQKNTPPDSRIIVSPCTYDQLYYCDRNGWVFNIEGSNADIDKFKEYISEGADYYITADTASLRKNRDFYKFIDKNYKNISPSGNYAVYVLNDKRKK